MSQPITFADFDLSDSILRAVEEKGYTTPSPIQERSIPAVLTGQDMIAAAQTGTGKTAGFTLPMMQLLDQNKPQQGRHVRALVLCPTRELAAQVQHSIQTYGKYLSLKSLVVFGGVNIRPQIAQLRSGVDILVATPGRLLDLCNQNACNLSRVEMFILDEADRMLDMGFINDIRKVMKLLPRKRQTLLFSATFSQEIRVIIKEFLNNPITIEISPENTTAQTVSQRAYRSDSSSKTALTIHLIKQGNWEQVLVFTRTKHGANRLSKKLEEAGLQSSAIHGNKAQTARIKALDGFKKGKIRVLVATDIAARGIDIASLPHVINYELPNVPEDYVHRIGRTGRAGLEGEAISLVSNEERPFLSGIEKLIGKKIELLDVPGFELTTWTARAPTANEVQKASNDRRIASRQSRGPRSGGNNQKSSFGGNKSAPHAPKGGQHPFTSSRRNPRNKGTRRTP